MPIVAIASFPNATILGATVHGPTREEAVDLLEYWIEERAGRCRSVVVTGFHGLWLAHKDPSFRQMLNSADLFCPDGIAPVWLSKLHARPLPQRVPAAT